MLLRPAQIGPGQAGRLQPLVDVAMEGKHRLAGVVLRETFAERGVACDVECRELVADGHERGDVLGRPGAQIGDQRPGLRRKLGQRVRQPRREGTVIVQRLGGGE